MLIREGDQRTVDIDLKLATLLAGVAGALNGAGFQAAGFFSANMTGNVSSLSDHLALGRLDTAALFAAMIVSFILGACCSGFMIEIGRQRGVRGIYAYSVLLEAGLLLLLGPIALFFRGFQTGLVICLSFIMGVQNAATTRISDARVRTTHVSGMATDIGLGLAALVRGQPAPRFRLSLFTLTAFLAGGVLGVFAYLLIDGWLLIIAGIALLAIGIPEAHRARGGA
ncbi:MULTISPECIES: YoaK family protein [unclassified Devosia]|uniref:YoaK family protein n=1 Tax=unclassified Devosia TaxID=196773 RepID=UPI0025EAECEB|nr:YoaK family protein [Devosia sp.]MCR6634240.1 DUF1275 domain-containing protein [Devosia sp.]